MNLPCYHTVYYKNFAIYYMNGLYKIGNSTALPYLSMNAAKKEIDRLDALQNTQLFDNQKRTDACETTDAKR